MDIDQRVARAKADIAAAQRARAAAEAARAIALDRQQTAQAALQAEFGVSTPEEAAALEVTLQGDLDRELRLVEAQLAKAEGQ